MSHCASDNCCQGKKPCPTPQACMLPDAFDRAVARLKWPRITWQRFVWLVVVLAVVAWLVVWNATR